MVNVKQIVEWLGPEGATAGLTGSDLTVAVFRKMAVEANLSLPSKLTRSQLIEAIVDVYDKRITKTIEELVEMNQVMLLEYLQNVQPSRRELLKLLSEIDIRPPGKGSGNLLEFIAREISDIGIYQRVAKGHTK